MKNSGKNNSPSKKQKDGNSKNEKKKSPDRKCEYGVKTAIRLCADSNCRQKRGRCSIADCSCNNKHNNCKDFLNYSYIKSIVEDYEKLNQKILTTLSNTIKSLSNNIMKIHQTFQKQFSEVIEVPKPLLLVSKQITESNVEQTKKFFNMNPGFEFPEKIFETGGLFSELSRKIKGQIDLLVSAQRNFEKNARNILKESQDIFKKEITNHNELKKTRILSKSVQLSGNSGKKNQMSEG